MSIDTEYFDNIFNLIEKISHYTQSMASGINCDSNIIKRVDNAMFLRPKTAEPRLEKALSNHVSMDLANAVFVMRELITLANVEYLVKEINTGRFKTIDLESSTFASVAVFNKVMVALSSPSSKVKSLNLNGVLKSLVDGKHHVIKDVCAVLKSVPLEDFSLADNHLSDDRGELAVALNSNKTLKHVMLYRGNFFLKRPEDVAKWKDTINTDLAAEILDRRKYYFDICDELHSEVADTAIVEAEDVGYRSKRNKNN